VAKLDVLLNQSGEVVLGHGQSSARLDELSATTKQFDRWRADFSRVAAAVRRHLRQRERAGPSDAPGNGPLVSATLLDPLARLSEQLDRLQRRLDGAAGGLAQQLRSVEQAAEQLDEEVRQLRMLPVAEAFHGLERTVRDLAAAANKAIDLVIQGGEVALDRTVIELLKTPLLHLVRNAVDHGIESQAERVSSGKPSRGRIVVAAVLRGDRVSVRVQDDGRGLDLEALREQVRRRGLPEPYDDAELARLIFLPGVSTARLVTDVSGRGVGLDVVRSQVEALRGTIDVTFEPGRGAGFTLTVPLTLTTMRVLMVQSAGQIFGLPVVQIERLLRVGIDEVASVGGRSVVMLNGSALPLVSLAKILGLGEGEQPLSRKVPAVVLIAAGQRIGLAVQALLEEREVLVKSLGSRIKRLRHFSGTTIRPDGRVALLLSAMALVETALAQPAGGAVLPTPSPAAVRKRLLVADDSITTRTLIKTILEASGYEVAAAADGAEAWQLLQDKNFDLVVSDVDMPRMDGFALTETIRGSKRFRTLPVILVTALESDADKVRGMQAGADAYLKKSAFDQRNLLETIRRLL
jgi:two-component system chemotaxis sensor kinase CheA